MGLFSQTANACARDPRDLWSRVGYGHVMPMPHGPTGKLDVQDRFTL